MKVENLSKAYRTKGAPPVQALKGVSFILPDTGMVFLLGRSGSGKSTLLHILSGLESFDAGDITYRGNRLPTSPSATATNTATAAAGSSFRITA